MVADASRVLVTTADQRSWVEEQPMLFLGQWCALYSEREKWQNKDIATVPYHWDDRQQLEQDYWYLRAVYEKVFKDLAKQLNRFHSTQWSERAWRILIGPWLSFFTEIIFDRWKMLRLAYQNYDIENTIILAFDAHTLVPAEMDDFIAFFIDDSWNHWVYGEIIKRMEPAPKFEVKTISQNLDESSLQHSSTGWRDRLKSLLNKTSGMFAKRNKVFLISSYLKPKEELLLSLKLGQMPSKWFAPQIEKFPVSMTKREQIQPTFHCDNEFESILKALIPMQIPTCYLEGFKALTHQTLKCSWPENVKVIYNANAYTSNDFFKAWCARQVDRGSKLIIGQHGGNFGCSRLHSLEDHMMKTSDLLANWGWANDEAAGLKALSANNLKRIENLKSKNDGEMLLTTLVVPRYSYWIYSISFASQHQCYLDDLFEFINQLPPNIFDKTKLRLAPTEYGWQEQQRLKDAFPAISYDDRKQGLLQTLSDCRLFVGTYDATTHLETLSSNFPSVLYWNPQHWELRKEAEPYYERLKAVGILHDTPQSAALHIAAIWSDVTSWWETDDVQAARLAFCGHFAHVNPDGLTEWAHLFKRLSA